MRNIDFSPLYRSAIGFDRLFNLVENNAPNANGGYPPYNIEQQDENHYRITMAVAGFAEAQLDITQQQNTLIVKGNKAAALNNERHFLYQGIADRNFERKFQLADHVNVVGANMENGLLHIDLEREIPEEMKPRKISIGSGELIENKE
ncbi:small heat shock chaperone IbpA [Thaumasiovibrio sp. DFM-14]|uniref:small heat shock chaperone IbpA n=1 Tax=Thaumasiovibrio sp. DFM-14 TaxID=3384792 RepID=UPI0039A2492B